MAPGQALSLPVGEDSGLERPRGKWVWEGGRVPVELISSRALPWGRQPGQGASESADKPGAWRPELSAFLTGSLLSDHPGRSDGHLNWEWRFKKREMCPTDLMPRLQCFPNCTRPWFGITLPESQLKINRMVFHPLSLGTTSSRGGGGVNDPNSF